MPHHHLLSLPSPGPSLEGPLLLTELGDVRVGTEAGWCGDSSSVPWEGLGALQGLRWPQRTAHLPFYLETVMQIKCGLCQVPGMPLPHPGPLPSQPAANLHFQFTNSLLLWSQPDTQDCPTGSGEVRDCYPT